MDAVRLSAEMGFVSKPYVESLNILAQAATEKYITGDYEEQVAYDIERADWPTCSIEVDGTSIKVPVDVRKIELIQDITPTPRIASHKKLQLKMLLNATK